jgi:mono/diheme cytochrome c family protein
MMAALQRFGDTTFYAFTGCALGVGLFVAHTSLAARPFLPVYAPPGSTPPGAAAVAPSPAAPSDPKQAAYEATCGSCHQATGKGLPGVFPPLVGSEWVTRDAETPIRIALLGVTGPIDVAGQHFESTMPALGLDDAKVAAILTYVRSAWGNSASAVKPEDVAAVRAGLAGRTTAFDAATLQNLRSQ